MAVQQSARPLTGLKRPEEISPIFFNINNLMSQHEFFELRRLSDDTVYQFTRLKRDDGGFGYKRQDKDVWIIYDPQLGWYAPHPETGEVAGKPWNHLPREQSDYPPEGEWVSKKGSKSYVYQLVYVTDISHWTTSSAGAVPPM